MDLPICKYSTGAVRGTKLPKPQGAELPQNTRASIIAATAGQQPRGLQQGKVEGKQHSGHPRADPNAAQSQDRELLLSAAWRGEEVKHTVCRHAAAFASPAWS